jgi:predicted DNA binding CopG/RHH family protein
MKRVQFIFSTKQETLSVSLPETLFVAVRKKAKRAGVPYQRFIRHALERAVTMPKRLKAKAG